MRDEELIAFIKKRFQQGQRRSEIKEELLTQGYTEEDIDVAIRHIQNDAFKHLPGIAWITYLIERFDKQTEFATPKMTIMIMASCVAGLLLLAGGLYLLFDPLNSRAIARDTQRQTDARQLQSAIVAYYKTNGQYPASLTVLMPKFLPKIPHDPQTGAEYQYRSLDAAQNYELCVTFELQVKTCATAAPISSQYDIPIVPTATIMPTFTPQSASESAINSL
jgi:hypothetical protein